MAEYHADSTGTTVVSDDSGANVLIAVVAVVVVGALIWLLAFSGMVFDRSDSTPPRGVTNNEFNTENNNEAPPAQPAPQEPAPAQS